MSKEKDSLILYESFFEATQDLSVSEVGEIWKALHLYLATDEDYEFQSITSKLAWNFIKLQLNADAKKWQETCKRRSEAGKRGMQKRWKNEKDITSVNFVINENNKNNKAINAITKKSSVINEITKITDTDTESESDTESDTDIFIENKNIYNNAPTKEQILKLAKDPSVALSPEEAEKFYDNYTAQSWTRSNGRPIANTPQALVSMLRMWKSNAGNFTQSPRVYSPPAQAMSLADFKRKFNAIYDYNGTDIDEDSTDYIDKMILFVRKMQSVDDFKTKYPNEYANIVNRKDK